MQVQTNAERLYFSSISLPNTQNLYKIYLQKYLAFYGLKNATELLTKDHNNGKRKSNEASGYKQLHKASSGLLQDRRCTFEHEQD